MSNKLECCAVAHWREVAESNEQLASNLSAEIARLTAEVERLQHDVFAYRLALGYEIPGDHDGLLSDGRQPLNGPALAAWGHYDTLRSDLVKRLAVVDTVAQCHDEWDDGSEYHRVKIPNELWRQITVARCATGSVE